MWDAITLILVPAAYWAGIRYADERTARELAGKRAQVESRRAQVVRDLAELDDDDLDERLHGPGGY